MPPVFTISEAARRIGVAPRLISDLFYARKLPDEQAPVVSGRRLISPELMPEIERLLIEQGRLAKREAATC